MVMPTGVLESKWSISDVEIRRTNSDRIAINVESGMCSGTSLKPFSQKLIKSKDDTHETMALRRKQNSFLSLSSLSDNGADSVTLQSGEGNVEEDEVLERSTSNTPKLPDWDGSSMEVSKSEESLCNRSNTAETERNSSANEMSRNSSFYRRERTRTLEDNDFADAATTERMRRNTDSMIEDVVISKQLKRRLSSRWQMITKRTIENKELSDFIRANILEGSLDALAAAKSTSTKRLAAADIAMESCMGGYFLNMEDSDLRNRLRYMFAECLQREVFHKEEFVCRENEVGNKAFVIEEGRVQFTTRGQIAGYGERGSSFGELCIVYGVTRQASVQAVTECVITWTINDLSFRRMQALVALGSLKHSKSNFLNAFPKRASSLSDLQEAVQHSRPHIRFEEVKKLSKVGQGTFGSVCVVTVDCGKTSLPGSEKYFAMKCMSKQSIVNNDNQKRVLIEKNALHAVGGSPFIITLLSVFQDDHSIYFLNEFVQGGNLLTYMIEKDTLNHYESLFFCANIVCALIHIHKKGFIHRDIKPENCLICLDGYLKLCDFGMAKRIPSTIMLPNGGIEVVTLAFTMCGTPEFMAPEFVLSTGYDKGVDFWALGCILVEMYTGRSPFEFDGDLRKTFREVCLIGMGKKSFSVPEVFECPDLDEAKNFIKGLLTKSNERIGKDNSRAALKHDYFSMIDTKNLKNKKVKAPVVPELSDDLDLSNFNVDDSDRGDDTSLVEPYDGDSSWCDDICMDNSRVN